VITRFEAEDYGPLKRVSCALTPLHAFIGPNDSGKSTLLRGIVTAVNARQGPPTFNSPRGSVRIRVPSGFSGAIFSGGALTAEEQAASSINPSGLPIVHSINDWSDNQWLLKGARLVRFEPDALRESSPLVPDNAVLNYLDVRGAGLPGVFDVLNNRNDGSFQAISAGLTRLFPTVARLKLLTMSASEKMVAIELTDGTTIPATGMSEGMLYYLAYAALQRLTGVALLAIEEPETGLHPSRIAEVVRMLRAISESGTQVIIATHSPLVVNELHPDEVSVVRRHPVTGTEIRPIKDTPNFDKRSKVYALGELWLSYANGTDESPLLDGPAE
jgi:predicted ATPase